MASRICLLKGQHTPGSDWEHECPLRNAAERSDRARKAAQRRYAVRQHRVEQRKVSERGPAAPDTEAPEQRTGQPRHRATPVIWIEARRDVASS
jgi:hypothetical protein